MIHQKFPREEMAFSANLATALQLVQIRPQKVFFDNKMPKAGDSTNKELKVSLKRNDGSFELREGYLDITMPLALFFLDVATKSDDHDGDTEDYLAKIELEYLLTFTIPSDPMPQTIKDKNLPAFVKINALMIAWPYMRHHIDHLASASSIPFVMPIICLDAIDSSTNESEKE